MQRFCDEVSNHIVCRTVYNFNCAIPHLDVHNAKCHVQSS